MPVARSAPSIAPRFVTSALRRRAGSAWVACLGTAALLVACSGGTPGSGPAARTADSRDGQLAWARAALERNSQLQVVAVDERARIFTVRLRDSGQVRTVRLEELVAGPPPAAYAAIRREPPPVGSVGAAELAAAAPAVAAAHGEAPVPGTSAGPGGDGAGAGPPAAAGAAAAGEPGQASAPGAASGVVVEREGGKVRISGPGVSITSAEPADPRPAASATAGGREQRAPSGARRVEPLICQGSRELRLDGQSLDVRGNAVEVELGCRLFLTNSRIVAGETGIVVRRGGEVHLANTTVEGRGGAVALAAGAELYTATSTFRGGLRREPGAEVHDLGNNTWR